MHDFENELYVLTLFYKQRYHIVGKSTKKYFQNRLDKVNLALRTSYTVEDFLRGNVEIKKETTNKKGSTSNDELLFKYAELYEKGLITREEFDKKKKELL